MGFTSVLLIQIVNKFTNMVSIELVGFRRSKYTFIKGNVMGMVWEPKKGQ